MKELMDFISNYSIMLGSIEIDLANLFWIIELSSLIFIYKGVSAFRSQKKDIDPNSWDELKQYHIERTTFCTLSTTIVSYLFIAACGQTQNLALDYVVIPFIGVLTTLYLNYFFKKQGWVFQMYPENKSKEKPEAPLEPVEDENSMFREITEDEVNEKGVAWFLNLFGRDHNQLRASLEENCQEMKRQSEVLDALRQERIFQKHQELEDAIYRALNKNFATPAEDKAIREKYRIYRLLGGNGDIQQLFEGRYMHIDIHDDRRKKNVSIDFPDRRNNANKGS